MQFSEQWLRTMCNPPVDSGELAERLTMAGLEVEEARPAAPPFAGVVVGRIDAVAPHPNADRLRVCTVDVGEAAPLTVVCGAPNAAAGMLAPCAREGATLPGGLVIRRAAMRGVESQGMLCSGRELGIDDDASGLLALDASLAPGTPLRDALALDDTLITLKITPNRADCLSIAGIARDVAAVTGAAFVPLDVTATPVAFDGVRQVRVEEPEACPRFVARLIDGIDPRAPTPAWMKQRLERSGLRSISAVVDITNYVMLEMGQPLHAYDDRLLDGAVVVRFANEGEQLTLLNGQVLDLASDLLMVADEKKPLGLAGIMGGEHSGINDTTTTVFLAPFLIARFMMMAGNWGQHAFVCPDDPGSSYKSAITCVNIRYNRRCFNDGYHISHHLSATRHWTEHPQELLDNVEKYRDADAVIFEGIDFHGVWFFLMTKNYPALAKHFVDLRETRRSDDEIIALLKKRTGAIDCTKPEILAAVPA